MEHVHEYDESGKRTCCSFEDKLINKTNINLNHSTGEGHDEHNHEDFGYWPSIISLVLLISGLYIQHIWKANFFEGWFEILWYILAYIPVAFAVVREAIERLMNKEVFTEFFLMTIATIGAFAIGEYPEAVAVMLFYAVGELFQGYAVKTAKNNINALLDIRPKTANVFRNNVYIEQSPANVGIGERIQIKVGEKIPLDGKLLTNKASLNTAALTGESRPRTNYKGDVVLAGSINMENVIELIVTKKYEDSSISRILDLVQNASAKKAKTELLIRKLAKVYTPIVVYVAIAVCFIPYFIVENYHFSDWLYRALIFLVISCPCALVISIPLGYFGGLGAASRNGILFKGATYLDEITKINTLVMDKTGTVTKGVFSIQKIFCENMLEKDFMAYVLALEKQSNHPIAKAIMMYGDSNKIAAETVEFAGKGIKGIVENKTVLVGNERLLETFNIAVPSIFSNIVETTVLVAIDDVFMGYIVIADEIKNDAKTFVDDLTKYGIKHFIMLSGDKQSITSKVAAALGVKIAKGDLLPEQKMREVEKLQMKEDLKVAFVGDGINDAPVLAVSDVGIAMGALGSDVAIETADVIIQSDQPSKILTGIKIGQTTQKIIWQNIYLAFGLKVLVLILGAGGLATMWEAVFADVGVALLAILNAIRIQRKKY